MFHIEHVEIDGFWRKYTASTKLYPDVNIFIGYNGTGKTTFMNLLLAALRADINTLAIHDFKSIEILLKENRRSRKIKLTKQTFESSPYDFVKYKVGNLTWELPLIPTDSPYSRPGSRHMGLQKSIQLKNLKEELNNLLSISSLSVHRTAEENSYEEDMNPRSRKSISPIDLRLDKLIQQLTVYQLSLAEQSSKVSSIFQKDVLLSMLYEEKFDSFAFQEIKSTELVKEKEGLTKAYKELGAFDENSKSKIDLHISALRKSLEEFKKFNENKGTMSINDIMPLSLFKRTQHVINLSLEAEGKKQEIFSPIRKFINILGKFLRDKKIYTNQSGELTVEKDGNTIPIPQLSSGEKQLIILLTETLLQRNQPFVFLADEPELSLHIEWQAQVISSIKQLNPKSQIIVATHSPEITSGWINNVLQMESVVTNGKS